MPPLCDWASSPRRGRRSQQRVPGCVELRWLEAAEHSNGITLDHRIWEITEADMRKAEAGYKEARDRLSPEEFLRLLTSGEISVAMFDNSRRYWECISDYIAKARSAGQTEWHSKMRLTR